MDDLLQRVRQAAGGRTTGWRKTQRELEEHLYDCAQDLIKQGYAPDEAERLSVLRFGDPAQVGRQLRSVHAKRRYPFPRAWAAAPLVAVLAAVAGLLVVLFGGIGANGEEPESITIVAEDGAREFATVKEAQQFLVEAGKPVPPCFPQPCPDQVEEAKEGDIKIVPAAE